MIQFGISGKKLREIREARSVTQAAVGESMGVVPERVSVIESERRGLASIDTAIRYLQALAGPDEVKIYVHVRGFIGEECVLEDGSRWPE